MAEYIEREAVVKRLEEAREWCKNHLSEGKFKSGCIAALDDELFNIQTRNLIPTADVVEVKHGEWKPKHYEGGFMDGTNFEECSICRYHRYFDDIRFKLTFDYCPKCGAKMDLKEGAEE